MLSRSAVRKLLHQHFFSLLHSRRAFLLSIFTISLLLFSLLQFGDSLLEWSSDKYRMIQHAHQTTNNILGTSFGDLCYNSPIDVVYTWVNGSDPWHQKQLENYRSMNLDLNIGTSKESLSREEKLGIICASSVCVQAKAVLVSPRISLKDLSEVFDDQKTSSLITYSVGEQTLALAPDSFHLDDLLEEKNLIVNGVNYHFTSVHLMLTAAGQVLEKCFPVDFISIAQDGRRTEKGYLMDKFAQAVQRVDTYDSRELLVIYSKSTLVGETFEVGNKQLVLEPVCLMSNIKITHKDNELQLSRFKDNEELRYSIRSLVKHAGWVRRIYIVTNGQIPYWLNLENPRVRIVTHEMIFLNKSDLPTFSSSAIESHLHRISGLSKKFIYFNDDVLLGQNVLPEDFFSHSEGYKIHLSWHVPACSEGCPSGWLNDGFCDATCNNFQCNFDGIDCVNKTKADDFDDAFDNDKFTFTGTCYPGCLNAWLADRYCDTVCDHYECGFDIGDCGVEVLDPFPHIILKEDQRDYIAPAGSFVVVLNSSQLFLKQNVTLKEGSYKQTTGVRAVSVYPKKNVCVIILYLNATGTANLTLNFADNNSTSSPMFDFTVSFDSTPSATTPENDAELFPTFPTIPENMKSPRPRRLSLVEQTTVPAEQVPMELAKLQRQFELGLLTEYGIEVRKSLLLGVPLNISTAKPTSLSTSTLSAVSIASSSGRYKIINPRNVVDEKQGDDPVTTRKGRIATEWQNQDQKEKTLRTGRPSSKNSLKNLDAFADSLRYVNRLYNDAFGIEARKVPAHVPHFIDKDVMEELQQKFPGEFANTSATRVRSSHNMQFAFSYFYYIMDANAHLQFSEIFNEIDTDHSGSWNHREIYLAALRASDGPTDEKKIHHFYSVLSNCTQLQATEKEFVSAFEELVTVNRSSVMACQPVVQELLKANEKKKRFKFRIGDSEGFTFVRVGNNATVVSRELDSILRHPKKFICINDEVDYTREDSAAVQSVIRDFFETLYPISSPFELPLGKRNVFSHMQELTSWETKNQWLFAGFVTLALLTTAVLFLLCFPRCRWTMYRLFSGIRSKRPTRNYRISRMKV